MKRLTLLFTLLKACFILLVSGWRSVKHFGNPNDIMGTFIVCLENKGVMEMNYSNLSNRWWKIGIGDECVENKVIYWKPLPKFPACH
jgi:hypothetical protein